MAFISYAQNFEDVILWRALRNVENGFYVDVGAFDPQVGSVTHAFYERGWSGINIEPLDEYFVRLMQERPRDTNLKVAVGQEAGIRPLYAFDGTGLSILDPKVGVQHESAGFQGHEIVVPVLPLTKILEDFRQRTIHFLKIDVEGTEGEVVESLDLDQIRPWIIVVEATELSSTLSTRATWEHLITNRRYSFAYFDGLNCFYVADETHYLKEKIAVPVNVFDEFVRSEEWASKQKVTILEQELISAREYAQRVEAASERLNGQLNDVVRTKTHDLNTVLLREKAKTSSLIEALQVEQRQVQLLCQRINTPVLKRIRDLGDRITGGGARALTRRLITEFARRAMCHSPLLALGRWLLKPFPRLTTHLHEAVTKSDRADHPLLQNGIEPASLSVSAKATLCRLQNTLSQNSSWN
jgi:FkbM family methyltransferase